MFSLTSVCKVLIFYCSHFLQVMYGILINEIILIIEIINVYLYFCIDQMLLIPVFFLKFGCLFTMCKMHFGDDLTTYF